MDIRIDRPILDRERPEENIEIIAKWIADTSDKLNFLINELNKGKDNNNGTSI